MNVMNVGEEKASQLVRLWHHSRKQGFVSPLDPSRKQPYILQALFAPFKDAENHDRKGGFVFSLAWKHEQCI